MARCCGTFPSQQPAHRPLFVDDSTHSADYIYHAIRSVSLSLVDSPPGLWRRPFFPSLSLPLSLILARSLSQVHSTRRTGHTCSAKYLHAHRILPGKLERILLSCQLGLLMRQFYPLVPTSHRAGLWPQIIHLCAQLAPPPISLVHAYTKLCCNGTQPALPPTSTRDAEQARVRPAIHPPE